MVLSVSTTTTLAILTAFQLGQAVPNGNPAALLRARAHFFGYGLDGSALTGSIAAFEQNDGPLPLRFHPVLHVTQLDLELAEVLFVELSLHLAVFGLFDPRHVVSSQR